MTATVVNTFPRGASRGPVPNYPVGRPMACPRALNGVAPLALSETVCPLCQARSTTGGQEVPRLQVGFRFRFRCRAEGEAKACPDRGGR
eukprot:scaffold377_cov563-Prasinococcus_capsulatus_cf.AAC.5